MQFNMPEKPNYPIINVKFHTQDGLSCSQLTSIVNAIERACFNQEVDTIGRLLGDEATDILNSYKAHPRWQWEKHSPVIKITDARRGSIVFEGVIYATLTWVLLNTIGESFKEAWKETELHNKLKDLFLFGRVKHADGIANEINTKLESHHKISRHIKKKSVKVEKTARTTTIYVEILLKEEFTEIFNEKQFPKQAEELAKKIEEVCKHNK